MRFCDVTGMKRTLRSGCFVFTLIASMTRSHRSCEKPITWLFVSTYENGTDVSRCPIAIRPEFWIFASVGCASCAKTPGVTARQAAKASSFGVFMGVFPVRSVVVDGDDGVGATSFRAFLHMLP